MQAEPVQALTHALLIACLLCLIPLARRNWRYDWSLYLIAAGVVIHAIIFYTFILFFYDAAPSYTYWSRLLRLHEVASLLIILITMIIRPYIWGKLCNRRRGDA